MEKNLKLTEYCSLRRPKIQFELKSTLPEHMIMYVLLYFSRFKSITKPNQFEHIDLKYRLAEYLIKCVYAICKKYRSHTPNQFIMKTVHFEMTIEKAHKHILK